MQKIKLSGTLQTPRVIRGGWQLSSGHGNFDRECALRDIGAFANAGITAVDCGDIYTGVEELLGEYMNASRASGGDAPLQIHTKYVPDLNVLHDVDFAETKFIIERSLTRLRLQQLPLVQFHWWDFSVNRYIEVAQHLVELRSQGLIGEIGVTNFDGKHLRELINAGIPVVSNQVQYSVLDHRPAGDVELQRVCAESAIQLLCYGTMAGGFISDRYLNRPAPDSDNNRSQTKYRLIIDEYGGWDMFQGMLQTLHQIGKKHGVSSSVIANAYVLQQPHVAAVIVGARNTDHLPQMQAIDKVRLGGEDILAIRRARAFAKGPDGDVYALERDRNGKHGQIMRYDLNNMVMTRQGR